MAAFKPNISRSTLFGADHLSNYKTRSKFHFLESIEHTNATIWEDISLDAAVSQYINVSFRNTDDVLCGNCYSI